MIAITWVTALLLTGQVDAAATAPAAESSQLLKAFREEFIPITPGRGGFPAGFMMGGGGKDQKPAHRVTLKVDFHVARYEVTQNLWQAVMVDNPSRWKGPRNSVEMLNHDEAAEFCSRVTALLREARLITDQQIVRLPSEAEWEYVARAGTGTLYSFGDDATALDDYAWHTGNAAGNDPPVGAKKANPWQLYDVHGYLWEWCADAWHDDYQGAPADGSVWTAAGEPKVKAAHVLRGGSWKDPAEKLTSAFRRRAEHTYRDDAVGLRCVLGTE